MESEEEEYAGIDKDHAHARARQLAPEDFFWDGVDELAPFGSDEGFTALEEFRDWRKDNPSGSLLECLTWTIESVGEIDIDDYNDSLLTESTIQAQMTDDEFNRGQYVFTLDVSVLATGFGQLVDEGYIEAEAKPLIQRAIDRQVQWNAIPDALIPAEYAEQYQSRLQILTRILGEA